MQKSYQAWSMTVGNVLLPYSGTTFLPQGSLRNVASRLLPKGEGISMRLPGTAAPGGECRRAGIVLLTCSPHQPQQA
jgi:hypothetical protein